MKSISKEQLDCDNDAIKENWPMNISGAYFNTTVIPGSSVSGTSFIVNTITLNTSTIRNSCIKIDFTSNMFASDFDETVNFQVFKRCYNQLICVGPVWMFSSTVSSTTTFSFFVFDYDCNYDCSNNPYCTYVVVATIQ